MHFLLPFLITFFAYSSYSYLLATYSFISKDFIEVFGITKFELGIVNGISTIGMIIATLVFLTNSIKISQKIVTFYIWADLGFLFPYLAIIFTSIVMKQPSKIILYILMFITGFFRVFEFSSILIMIKAHKQISNKAQNHSESNYRLLLNIWAVCFDIGVVAGFFVSNWLHYTLGFSWQYLLIIGVSCNLISKTVLLFGLRQYLEQRQVQNTLLEKENQHNSGQKQEKCETSISNFLHLINKNVETKLYLANATIMDALHAAFFIVLPPFFYSSGYKGSQGYLLAIYSLFIVIGTWLTGVIEFGLDKFLTQKSKKNQEQGVQKKNEHTKEIHFPFIYSIALLMCVITLILLAVLSFSTKQGESHIEIQMVLMCCLGLFFGGPMKSYFSHRTIKAMMDLQSTYKQEKKLNPDFGKIKNEQENPSSNQSPCLSFFFNRIIQIGSSLVTANRFLINTTIILMYICSFYLIQNYLSYLIVFYIIIAALGLVLDIIQNIVSMRAHKNKSKTIAQSNGEDEEIIYPLEQE